MHQIASDLNKAKRTSFFGVVVADWDHGDCPTGESLQEKIFGWLSAPDPWKNHHTACESRHRGTAEGSLRETRSQNGERPKFRVLFYGSMGNVCQSPAFAVPETEMISLASQRALEKASFGTWNFAVSFSGTYRIRKLHNHRRHPCHAESWTRIISFFLLRF